VRIHSEMFRCCEVVASGLEDSRNVHIIVGENLQLALFGGCLEFHGTLRLMTSAVAF